MEGLHHISTILVVSLLALSVSALDDDRNGRCPPLVKWGVCPTGAPACSVDKDCGQDMRCCESPCGGVCTKPLFTGCEHLQMAATRRARALGAEGRSVRIPRCTGEGDFDPIQCDNEIVGSCWCVDEAGFEQPGTRAPARGMVNCTAPAACAAATCRMLCPHGFTLAADGCPQCRCRDPCAGVRCPGQLSCQLEEVACLRQPCPPVPTCKRGRSLDNICPVGDPLLISDTHRPFLCGTDPGKPSCPPLYQCFVQRGNDYGVCCPASLKIQKPGMCPNPSSNSTVTECDTPCAHDLECPSMQKCCHHDECGKHCVFPDNLTECLQQKSLAEALSINEREGRGYIPQCSDKDGTFQQRQCSRNGLVCWCVNSKGLKSKGSMGPSQNVDCSKFQGDKARPEARSLTNKLCDRNICASICEYGFRVGADGCPSCECDDPCDGFPCKDGEECIPVKEQTCQEDFCPTYPVCRPKVTYVNPCMHDAPLTNDTTGEIINCDPEHDEDSQSDCPSSHRCIQVANSAQAVCCPSEDMMEEEDESEDYSMKPGLCPFSINQLCDQNTTKSCVSDDECEGDKKCCLTSNCGSVCADADIRETPDDLDFDRSPSMCEYLRDFNDKMEGTHDGMKLALPTPECHGNGSFSASQCVGGQCWCVDSFGTEVPATRGNGSAAVDCVLLRETSECLELTCRLGCDYGFVISPETQCPLCQCRNPCQDVSCGEGQGCQMVEVACDNDYCPPVPACLPQKAGECPYLVPSEGGSCDYACQSDAQCEGEHRCCSNGCGTHCVQPVKKTACEHQRAIVLHKSAEDGIPGRQLYVPACREADGAFELVQCHEAKGTCWCVDQEGLEISGTRTSGSQKPRCHAPSACPATKCSEKCKHGYALDSQGCSSCLCRDPCEDTKCYEGEVCRVVKVECVSEPCPPVALCVGKSSDGAPACGSADGTPARRCGPSEPPCPSSHKCHLPPLTSANDNPPVCCPKPRSVCFDPKDEGRCPPQQDSALVHQEPTNSTVRWYFSPEKNQCVQFRYEGCSGNNNNFQNEQHCNTVCPVLSQCERLREKNQKAAARYKKDTFIPRCRPDTGEWEAVQCMEHIGVCWCASGRGEPLRGSLVRGLQPACNFRQARRRMDPSNSNDDVLEELVRQMTAYNFIDSIEESDSVESIKIEQLHQPQNIQKQSTLKSRCLSTQERLAGSSAAYEVTCDSSGRFNPSQCESSARDAKCWCVDEAGNQLPGTSTFSKGDSICLPTPIEAVDITLGFFGDFSSEISKKMKSQLLRDLSKLGATLKDKQIELLKEPGVTYIHFTVIGNNKVDIAYHLEELVKQEELSLNGELARDDVTMVADIRKSTFHHKLGAMETKNMADNKIIALQHREILSESTVSVVTSYHTAIIVLAAASAFIISTMSVLLMLYRKKVSSMGRISSDKVGTFSDRFVPSEPPVYVLSRQEKEDLAEAMQINDKMDRDKV